MELADYLFKLQENAFKDAGNPLVFVGGDRYTFKIWKEKPSAFKFYYWQGKGFYDRKCRLFKTLEEAKEANIDNTIQESKKET